MNPDIIEELKAQALWLYHATGRETAQVQADAIVEKSTNPIAGVRFWASVGNPGDDKYLGCFGDTPYEAAFAAKEKYYDQENVVLERARKMAQKLGYDLVKKEAV